jgi:energy-coupling factor transport system ATP-binding protein
MIYPIEVQKLFFSYKQSKKNILRDINLKVSPGEILVITGLNGAGKSTLCHCLCGIIPHMYTGEIEGQVLLFGQPIQSLTMAKIAPQIGIVFQDPDTQLFSPTVESEIAFAPENLNLSKDEIGRRIDWALKKVGMQDHRYDNPNNLSGGQKQLIALASVLSLQPEILIFDEVFSQLDSVKRARVQEIVKELKNQGRIVILVTHNYDYYDFPDRVLLLEDGRLKPYPGL